MGDPGSTPDPGGANVENQNFVLKPINSRN
jgi:hypothetical protein